MVEREITVSNPLGLHARAAARLVRLANTFSSEITLVRDDTGIHADAKSILSVLYIAASCGVTLRVVARGPDQDMALSSIVDLFRSGFGENLLNEPT